MPRASEVEKALLYGIWVGIFLLLLMPFVVTTQTIFPFIVGKAIYARVIIEILFGAWVVLAYINPSYRLPRSMLLLLLTLNLGVSLLAGFFGVSLQRSLWSTYERMQGVIDLAHWVALTAILASVIRTQTNWRYLLNINVAISLLIALLGISQNYSVEGIPFYGFLEATSRIGITLGNPTFVGAYMMVNAFISLGLFTSSALQWIDSKKQAPLPRQRRHRRTAQSPNTKGQLIVLAWGFWLVTAALELWVLTLTGTRGAFLGLVVGILLVAVSYIVIGQLKVLRFFSIGLIVFLAVMVIGFFSIRNTSGFESIRDSNILLARISGFGLEDSSFRGRLATWSAGLEAFTDKPILGWGPENYIIIFGRYIDEDDSRIVTHDKAHNKAVEELTTKGIFGFLSYIAIWAFMSIIIFRKAKKQQASEQAFTIFIGAALAGYFTQNLFLFDTPATLLQLVLLMAYVTYLETNLGEEPTKDKNDIKALRWTESILKWLPAQKQIRGLSQSRFFTSNIASLTGVILVLTLVIFSLYFVNYRAYNAANAILQINRPTNNLDQTIGYFEESIYSFQPLANYPRLILFSNLATNWDILNEGQARELLLLVEREALFAIESEPENWRIHVELARVYQKAATLNPAYQVLSDSYLNKAIELAPAQSEVLELILNPE